MNSMEPKYIIWSISFSNRNSKSFHLWNIHSISMYLKHALVYQHHRQRAHDILHFLLCSVGEYFDWLFFCSRCTVLCSSNAQCLWLRWKKIYTNQVKKKWENERNETNCWQSGSSKAIRKNWVNKQHDKKIIGLGHIKRKITWWMCLHKKHSECKIK